MEGATSGVIGAVYSVSEMPHCIKEHKHLFLPLLGREGKIKTTI